MDVFDYFLAFLLFRTNSEPEPTRDTLLRISQRMPEGSTVAVDSYVGSIEPAEAPIRDGKHVLLSCTATDGAVPGSLQGVC